MTGKIFRSIFMGTIFILLITLITTFGALYEYFESSTKSSLKSQLDYAATGVELSGEEYLRNISRNISEEDYRLTLIDKAGQVVYDTNASPNKMDNHNEREEIIEARSEGVGESSRFSDTKLEKTLYYAKSLTGGQVLRISVTQDSVLMLVLGMLWPLIYIFVLAIFLSIILAKRMSNRIVKPLNNLNFDNPLENDVYDEISPLLSHIEGQNRKINAQINELKQNKLEFDSVIGNMSEGLVVLGTDDKVISMNNSARTLFNTNECVGRDFLEIDRSLSIENAIKNAKSNGHSELQINRNGREYQVSINRVGESEKLLGTIILTFDVTEKVFAERNRKEFTANVSHELKTPLQSIMGSAEIMQNGIVKEEDKPQFIEKIHTESARLLALIEDIIRLSQLDEKINLDFEKVDLYSVSKDVIKELKEKAEKHNVEVLLSGEEAEINAEPRLLHELIYNLVENAIKYNKEYGRVEVSIEKNTGKTVLNVSDTGIGIPEEHLSRVFERFYRVDKSHSKETGGTGLGLSIVKHSAEVLGAKVELSSEVGVGTKIRIEF